MSKTTKRLISELVFDYDVYPRSELDTQHVGYIAEAYRAGQHLPPVVICGKSRRIVDGFHRCKALLRIHGKEAAVDCIEKHYKSEADLFEDAIRYNAPHGRRLSTHDRVHCMLIAERLSLTVDRVAAVLCMSLEAAKELTVDRTAVGSNSLHVPLKRTVRHMAGQTLTEKQEQANDRLSGMQQVFYVNQVITLIESDMLDTTNEQLMERLAALAKLIRQMKLGARS